MQGVVVRIRVRGRGGRRLGGRAPALAPVFIRDHNNSFSQT